jgi:hypothetical protein
LQPPCPVSDSGISRDFSQLSPRSLPNSTKTFPLHAQTAPPTQFRPSRAQPRTCRGSGGVGRGHPISAISVIYIGSAVLCFVVIFLCHVSLLLPLRITDARSSLPRLLSSSHTFLSPSPGVLSLASSPLFLHRRPFFLRSLPTAKSEKALFSPFNIFFPLRG